jgi:hypothetical protein
VKGTVSRNGSDYLFHDSRPSVNYLGESMRLKHREKFFFFPKTTNQFSHCEINPVYAYRPDFFFLQNVSSSLRTIPQLEQDLHNKYLFDNVFQNFQKIHCYKKCYVY